MKKDITTTDDIENLVNLFYEKVKVDEIIGHFFSGAMQVNWEKHLPVMYKFWENIIFYTGNYSGNPLEKHIALNEKSPLSAGDFEQWKVLFNQSVDALFEGENATRIKQKAESIAAIMLMKILK